MMRRARFLLSGAFAALALVTVGACSTEAGSQTSPDAGNVGTGDDASPPSELADGPADGGGAETGSRSDAAPPGKPCTPPGLDITSKPTPGRCQGSVAITCDGETKTEHSEACSGDTECRTFELDERKFDRDTGNGWLDSRKYTWAACIPKDAAPCTLTFNSIGGQWRPVDKPFFTCDGDDEVSCRVPRPDYPEGTKDGWQLAVGALDGWFFRTPCPAGETCRQALHEDRTKCGPKSAAACTPGATARCEQGGVTICDFEYGYEVHGACAAGQVCGPICDGRIGCFPTGAAVCEPASKPTACDTATSYTRCNELTCLPKVEDCSSILASTPGGWANFPGKCAVVQGSPRCILTTDVVCDAATFVERCDGAKAVRCRDGLERAASCDLEGLVCGIASGKAGCKAAQAPACTAGSPSTCDGGTVVSCCRADGLSRGGQPCVPGYESRYDCTAENLSCRQTDPTFAECGTL